jgi:hypothetical protein
MRRRASVAVGVAVAVVLGFGVTAGQASAATTTGTLVGTNQFTFGSATTTTLGCPAGSTLTGFLVGNNSQVGGYPEDLALHCSWAVGSTTVGTSSDLFEASAACAAGEQGAGVYGKTGAIIDRIGIRCATPGSSVVTDGGLSPGADTTPAGPFDCPSGLVLTGVTFTKIGYQFDGNQIVNTVTGVCGVPITCTATITGNHGALALASGTTCLVGARIKGGISVSGGASLYIVNSTVDGSISASKAGALSVCGSTLQSLAVAGTTGSVVIGDSPADGCTSNVFNGSVNVTGNKGGVTVVDNKITGSLLVVGNSAPVVVSGNHT